MVSNYFLFSTNVEEDLAERWTLLYWLSVIHSGGELKSCEKLFTAEENWKAVKIYSQRRKTEKLWKVMQSGGELEIFVYFHCVYFCSLFPKQTCAPTSVNKKLSTVQTNILYLPFISPLRKANLYKMWLTRQFCKFSE